MTGLQLGWTHTDDVAVMDEGGSSAPRRAAPSTTPGSNADAKSWAIDSVIDHWPGVFSRQNHGEGCHVSASDDPISFEQDIKPLFRERDRESMRRAFDLRSHDDVAQHSDAIVGRLRDGTMPCDGAWPEEQVAVFQR